MKHFVSLPPRQRADFFARHEQLNRVHPVISEKDFWVCWLLGLIFATPALGANAVFKGGTSLSKVFGVIDRFSEDIDLGLSPASLGWPESELDDAPSNTARAKRVAALNAACADAVERRFMPALESLVQDLLGKKSGATRWLSYELETASHSPVIYFAYPATQADTLPYIRPVVKIEFGALTDQRPQGPHSIRPLIAELLPDAFADFRAEVVALEIERTFWEKATILHAEYHRPAEKPQPARYSRHYSDFAALWRHPSAAKAAADLDLLARVRLHKSRFFASSWASYATAVPGTLRLAPPDSRLTELRADYAAMQPMFIHEPLPFDEMLAVLREAEQALNQG